MPTANFKFAMEVYEQGRISRLRDDVGRQLEMLDEFAGHSDLKKRRSEVVLELKPSAEALAPLYEERDRLKEEIRSLPQLQQELAKEKLMPGADEQKWAKASAFVDEVETIENELAEALENIPSETSNFEHTSDLERLFGQAVPEFNPDEIIKADLLSQWRGCVKGALGKIETARSAIAAAIEAIIIDCKAFRRDWQLALGARHKALAETLRSAGVESPHELITRVNALQRQIAAIQTQKQPRLATLDAKIDQDEQERESLSSELERIDATLFERRAAKANELTDALDGKIKIEINASGDRTEYLHTLTDLCSRLATKESQIKNRDSQLILCR